jgi:predicted protein tyrosine phosphatase
MSPARLARVSALVSIDNPGARRPVGFNRVPTRLRLEFDDVSTELVGFVAPKVEHVQRLISFAARVRGSAGDVLVHCEAGISRSTAAVVILAAALLGPGRELEAVDAAFAATPVARPNRLMVALADGELGLDGKLVAALEARMRLGGSVGPGPRR